MTYRHPNRSVTPGFTLLELMIVLVLMVMLLAIAWPSLRKPLQRSSTQQAARQLYEDLAAARLQAIESGTTMSLRYEPGGFRYWIAPAQRGDDGESSGAPAEYDMTAADSDEASDTPDALWEIQGTLEDGVVFADPAAIDDEIPLDSTLGDLLADEMAETEEVEPLIEDELEETVWSAPVFIYPTGRAENAAIRLLDSKGYSLTVSVRGLTGAVKIGSLTAPRDGSGLPGDDAADQRLPDDRAGGARELLDSPGPSGAFE